MTSLRLQTVVLICVTGLMFWWRLGFLGLFDPDEPFYAQTTREMVQAHDWVTPQIFGQPQFEKPIFFYWQTIVAQQLFGDNELAARVPSALFATGLVFLTWIFGRRLLSPLAGFLAAVVLATGMEYIFMARLMLTDISLAFFVTAALYCLWRAAHEEEHRDRWVILQFVASGLATLTKGPLGVLLPALGGMCFLWLTRTRAPWRGRGLWIGLMAWLVIVVPWYAAMFVKFGWEYWDKFFVHENYGRLITAEHPRNNALFGFYDSGLSYYPAMLLIGSLPWIPLVPAAAARAWRAAGTHRGVKFIVCWSLPTLVFMTIAQSKLPSYIFFLFVPLALLVAHTLESWLKDGLGGPVERMVAGGLALLQATALLVATSIKPEYQAYRWAALIISAPLAGAAALLLLGRIRGWAITSFVASATILVVAFTGLAPDLEAHVSSKGILARIAGIRHPGEKIVTVKFMVRSVDYYYAPPDAVVHSNSNPWYSPHPIKVVVGDQGLAEYAANNGGSVLCVTQAVDLKGLSEPAGSALHGHCEQLAQVGDRVIFRVTVPPHVAVN